MIARNTNTQTIETREEDSSNSLLKRYRSSFYPELGEMMQNSNLIESLIRSLKPQASLTQDVFVKTEACYKKLKIQDIYLIEALCDYVNIYTIEKRYTVHSTLYSILEKLPQADYIRIHRSYIVRLDCINAIEDNQLVVIDTPIPIGKTYRSEVMSRLTIFQ